MENSTPNIVEKSTGELIREALPKAMSYASYRVLVAKLATEGLSTGPKQTEALTNYTQLNDRRMKRWDKTLKFEEQEILVIKSLEKSITWLVLTESWCGDASPALPVMHKISEINPNIDLKIVLRDENIELMECFLTNGAMSIPKLIAIDNETGDVLNEWGPRSKAATELVENQKALHGTLTPEFKESLQVWYNKDKGKSVLKGLLAGLPLK